ncbi:GNAT family N-acetyltransferase [Stutzerimonas tarimensis]|uniref:GNAT family N-acetyltransferase n=1 Tax=Stutzerimonas tarimensis TaxID=1507735 RepID=A0ABV7T6D9_9GAMM
MEISLAAPEDIPELIELLAQLFAQETEFQPDTEAQRRGLARIIANPEIGSILVGRREGVAVGMVNLLYTVSTALGEPVAVLEDLVVSLRMRGAGLGSHLLEAAVEHARSRGCKRITLLTDRDNEAAQHFYLRHGFYLSGMVPMRLLL